MYQKDHLSLPLGKYEVKIPNWFLREKGALSRDVFIKENVISIPKLHSSLVVKSVNEEKNIFQIGNYSLHINSKQIDLQNILTNPFYWLGNIDLVEFAGQGIFGWYRKTEEEKGIDFIERSTQVTSNDQVRNDFAEILAAKETSIFGLHNAVIMLQSELIGDNSKAIEYFTEILKD